MTDDLLIPAPRLCSHSNPIGYVASTDSRVSRSVCARPACRETAVRWVLWKTGERGAYRAFAPSEALLGGVS